MQQDDLRRLLDRVRAGKLSVDAALKRLKHLPFESLDFATIAHHRALRCGFPEVIYCPGKTTAQIVKIAEKLLAKKGNLLATRAEPAVFRALKKRFAKARYEATARAVVLRQVPQSVPSDLLISHHPVADLLWSVSIN